MSDQFGFRSTLQIKPGVKLNNNQTPVLDTRNYYQAGAYTRSLFRST